MRVFHTVIQLAALVLVSACGAQAALDPARGIPSPTPFQPSNENTFDSPYADSAPTPVYLPSVTPLESAPTGQVIAPEALPASVDATAFSLPIELNPLTGLPPSDPALLDRRPLAIKVANYPRYVRPQSGLTLADNIYEY